MIELASIVEESPLLDEKTKATIQGIFGKLEKPVTLKAVLDLSEKKSIEMATFLKGIAMLSSKIQLELYTPSEEHNLDFELDTKHLPVTGFYLDDIYQRIEFHGVPGGKEINSFIIAFYNLAGTGQELSNGTRKKIEKLKRPVEFKICVSLACHHCPDVVIACQRIAMLNEMVTAKMYDANLYPDMVEKYKIERVPMVIVNEKDVFMGPRSIEDLVQLAKDAR